MFVYLEPWDNPTVLFIFIHTDFTDFTDLICKPPVLTISVISVIRVTTSHPLSLLSPLSPWRGAGGEAFFPLPLERGWG